MSDDEETSRISPRDQAGPDHYGESLQYDFAKFMTTLSLLMLGGMLTLSGAARAGDIKAFNLMFSSGALAVAGVIAFVTASSLAGSRARGEEPPGYLHKLLAGAMSLMGVGIGGFLMMWMDSLN